MDSYENRVNEISLRDYIDLLRRRKAIFIQTFVLVLVVGLVVTFMTRPLYRTSSRILVEGKALTYTQMNSNDPLNNLFMPDTGHDVSTQIEVLQSEKVLNEAFKKVGVKPGTVHLDIKQVNNTDVIEITAESNSAKSAEDVARQLPDTYKNYVAGNRRVEISNALSFAQDRLNEESKMLALASLELQKLRNLSNVYSVYDARKSRLAEDAAARADVQKLAAGVASTEARYNSLIQERLRQPNFMETSSMSTNPQLEALRQNIASLRTQRTSMLVLFKPAHIKIVEIDAQINDMQKRLDQTPDMVTNIIRKPNPALIAYTEKIAAARMDLAAGRFDLRKAGERLARSNGNLNKFSVYEQQQLRFEGAVQRHSAAITTLTRCVEDLALRNKATHDPVLPIATASIARIVAPKKLDNILYAALLGIILGLCFALFQEYLDDRINAAEDARRLLQSSVLGYVPFMAEEGQRHLHKAEKGSALLESYRVLRSNVQFASVDVPKNLLMITSTVPGEGKSMTASNLAVVMAMDGREVILVDADLRRPVLHKYFNMQQQPGLTNVLVGHSSLDEALQATNVPGLRILTSGPLPPNPSELLNSQAMRQLHEQLKERGDTVIFDSPPVLATADAQVLSSEVDGVLYVLQFGEAKKSAVNHAAEMMMQAHANILGIIFNKIDLSGKGNEYYYGYYSYGQYYHSAQQLESGACPRHTTRDFDALISDNSNGSKPATALAVSGSDKVEKEG